MKKTTKLYSIRCLTIIGEIFGIVFNILCIVLLVLAVFTAYNSHKTGEPATIFGYKPVYVLTGSMEPYMKTDGVVVTKEIDSIDDIKVDDVVTYHVYDDDKKITITHRIKEIKEDGTIITKGDNNRVADLYALTIDNIEAKIVCVFNQVAWIISTWKTTTGKILLLSPIAAIILLYMGCKFIFKEEKTAEQS